MLEIAKLLGARYTGRWDGEQMVLVFQSDPLDTEDARGRFYHVCLGRMQEAEMSVPPPDQPYECPRCGVELETEDFWIAQVKGSV